MGKKVKKKKPSTERRPHEVKNLFETAYGYHVKGDYPKAEETYKQIIRLEPRHSNALNLLGTICLERGEYDNALDLIRKAVKAYPMGAMFHNNLGNVFRKMGMAQDAEKAYREALRVDPDCVSANNNLGIVLHDQGDMDGAIDYFEKAHRNDPGFAPAFYNLGRVFCEQGRIDTSIWAYREALKINPGFHGAYSNLLYTLHFSDTSEPEKIFNEHRNWAKSFAEPYYPVNQVYDTGKDPLKTLRIGYVSPDFRTHSVAFFLEDVIAHHNRKQVEIFCYSSTEKPDDFTRRFRELTDVWRDISSLSDDDAARIIMKDKIDILVDLAGHTRNSRILIFARKPAPVQVTWLGYPDTTGLDTMDYRITDAVADLPGHTDHLYTEKLVRLAGGFLCYRPSGESYPISPSPALITKAITFGSFNNNSKISESVIRVWSKILKNTPGSRIKLKSRSFSDFGTRKYILERFDHHGIPSERIWFEGYSVSLKEHFLLYGSVDIALDTFPYNGTTTTCEALWMGVPVIALSGNSHVARVGASLLHQVGLDHFLALSEDEYVEKAVNLAKDVDLLIDLRQAIRNRLKSSSLMDPTGFCKTLEGAYRNMWKGWIGRCEPAVLPDEKAGKPEKNNFEKNLECIHKHHPGLESQLCLTCPLEYEVRLTDTGLHNLYITDQKGVTSALYPEDDPSKDLPHLLDKVRDLRGKVVGIMGSGLLIYGEALLKTIGDYNLVVFFEAYGAVLRKLMESHDLSWVFSHPNARFVVGDRSDPYDILSSENDKLYTNNGFESLQFGPGVACYPSWYADQEKRFQHYMTKRQISLDTTKYAVKRFLSNIFTNLHHLSASRPFDALKDLYPGVPAVVVASGPSLSKNINELKKIKDNAIIIAADSALAPLLAQGIRPHYVASVDYNEFTFEKLSPYVGDLKDISLVYAPIVTPRILNRIRFKERYYVFHDASSHKLFESVIDTGKSALEDIHSVIHLALAMAQACGCNPIIFTGLDLSFDGRKDHADGTILHWNNDHEHQKGDVMIEGTDGGMVASSTGFVGMLEICERMISFCPERNYINATEGGAKIGGTVSMGLGKALDTYLAGEKCMKCSLSEGWGMNALTAVLKRLKELKIRTVQCLSRISDFTHEQIQVDTYIKKSDSSGLLPDKLPEKVLASLKRMDRLSGELDHDVIMDNLKGLLAEHQDQYLAFEMDLKDALALSDKSRRFKVSLSQQAFLQTIRKQALVFFNDHIDEQIGFLSAWIEKKEHMQRNPESGLSQLELARFLLDHDILVYTDDLLQHLQSRPEKDLILACVALKQGRINEGLALFNEVLTKDERLKPRVDSFISSMIHEWETAEGLESYKNLMIERIMLCDSDHPAVLKKQTMSIDKAWDFVKKGRFDDACHIMRQSCRLSSCDNETVLSLTGFLMIVTGMFGEGGEILKKAVSNSYNSEQRKAVLNYLCQTALLYRRPVEEPWFGELIDCAEKEVWARKILQEWWVVCHGQHQGRLITSMIYPGTVSATRIILEEWSVVKHVIPEWYVWNGFLNKADGEINRALVSMDMALETERNTITCSIGEGWLLIASGLVYLMDYRFEKSLEYLDKGLEIIIRPPALLVTACIYFWMGDETEGRSRLEKLFFIKDKPDWMDRLQNPVYRDTDFEIIKKLGVINPYAAWNVLWGLLMVESGSGDPWIHIKGSVLVDEQLIQDPYWFWIVDLIIGQWECDSERITEFLMNDDAGQAEVLLEEWAALYDRLPLSGFFVLKAECQLNNASREAALSYLEKEARNIHEKGSKYVEAGFLWEELGDGFLRTDNAERTLNCYENAMISDPGHHEILLKIGDVYDRLGNTRSAIMAYQTLYEQCPDYVTAKERLERLKRDVF